MTRIWPNLVCWTRLVTGVREKIYIPIGGHFGYFYIFLLNISEIYIQKSRALRQSFYPLVREWSYSEWLKRTINRIDWYATRPDSVGRSARILNTVLYILIYTKNHGLWGKVFTRWFESGHTQNDCRGRPTGLIDAPHVPIAVAVRPEKIF